MPDGHDRHSLKSEILRFMFRTLRTFALDVRPLWIRCPRQHLGSIRRHRLLSHPRSNIAIARGHAQKSLRQFCMEAGSLEEVASRPCMERQGYVDRFSIDRQNNDLALRN